MDINELRRRAFNRDTSAYLELSNEYGWRLYSYLQTRIDDKELLSYIYEKVLREFYQDVTEHNRQGSIETMLYEAADRLCGVIKPVPILPPSSRKVAPPTAAQYPPRIKKEGGFGFWLTFLLLLLLNVTLLWIIAGLLMDMGFLPVLDLGYSWFHANVAPWFW